MNRLRLMSKSTGDSMAQQPISDEDRVRDLARLSGIPIPEDEVAEVANRFGSLMQELDRLSDLDLADIQPVSIFPDEG
jgi:Asp-tRNA(Asn)/Glu-tRNA(Gln) amidotransferase C subunit